MSSESDPSAKPSDPLIIDVDATPVPAAPPTPRPVRTGRFSADDLAPPAPAPRMSGKLRPEDLAAIPEPTPTRPADFEAVDIAGMKAKMDTQRRAKLRPDSVFASARPAPAAPSPAPSASPGRPAAGKSSWSPLRRASAAGAGGPNDADTIIDVTARVIDNGDTGHRRATPSADGQATAADRSSPSPRQPAPARDAGRPAASASAAGTSTPRTPHASPPSARAHTATGPRTTAEMHPHRHRDRVDRSSPDSEPWPISEDSSTVPPPRPASRPAPRPEAGTALPGQRAAGSAGGSAPPPAPPGLGTGAGLGDPEPITPAGGSPAAANRAHRTPAAAASPAPRQPSPSGAPGFPPGLLKQCALALLSAGGGTFLLTMGWSFFGAWGVLPLVWGMQALVTTLAMRFERRDKFMTANWLATLAIVCTPLSVFYAQHAMGLWPPLQGLPPNTYGSGIIEIDWRRVGMDGVTTLFAWWMFMRHRHPVMLVPVTLALWYTLVEVGSYVLTARGLDLRFLAQVTAVYGLGAVLTSARIRTLGRAMPADTERRAGERPEHYAFWLEAIGALMLWAALWSYGPSTQLGRAAHLAAQLGLIGLGWRLRRQLPMALGAIGLALHIAALATGQLSPLVLLEPVLGPVAGWMASWRH